MQHARLLAGNDDARAAAGALQQDELTARAATG